VKRLLLFFTAAVLAACADPGANSGPPLERFYFPGSLEHVDVPGKTEGVLFVANGNFDKRYATGSVVALALDELGLPPLGQPVTKVGSITDLKLIESQSVQIASFAGEMAIEPVGANSYRLYVPTRSEGMRAYRVKATVDAAGKPSLACMSTEGQNCTTEGASLSPLAFEQSATGVPRAPAPYGVTFSPRTCALSPDCCVAGAESCDRTCNAGRCVAADGSPFSDVWFTHLTQADSPNLSATNFRGYLVRLDSDTFAVDEKSFIDIGAGGSNSVVFHKGWSYVSGRFLNPAPNLMRLVNRDGVVLSTALEFNYRVADARGLALSSDGKKLYMVGRSPDTLLVLSLVNPETTPSLTFMRGVALPDAPNQLKVIPRAGRGDLVVVTCTSGQSIALYDEDVGELVTIVNGVGVQPFGIAIDHRGTAARLYISDFGDGRVTVIDIPDLARPQGARMVLHLGAQQLCLTRGVDSPGCLAQGAPR
jgi:hypothetical protein